MVLDPLRAYITRRMTAHSSPDDLRIRDKAVSCALKLMSTLLEFSELLYSKDAEYHWSLFSIFDTAAVLCSVIWHDDNCFIPRRQKILMGIESARSLLQRLSGETLSAKTPYEMLFQLVKRMENSYRPPVITDNHHRPKKVADDSLSLPSIQNCDVPIGFGDVGSAENFKLFSVRPIGGGVVAQGISSGSPAHKFGHMNVSNSYQMPPISRKTLDTILMPTAARISCMLPTPREPWEQLNLEEIPEEQLSDLAALWNYQSMDFNFAPTQNF